MFKWYLVYPISLFIPIIYYDNLVTTKKKKNTNAVIKQSMTNKH